MNSFYKDGYFWRKPGPEWEKDLYGEAVNGKGDLIFNTCAKIIDDGDRSEWGEDALGACSELLRTNKRWPDRMDQNCDGITYRTQDDMTRDPYISWITACLTVLKYSWAWSWIYSISIPWYLFNPGVWTWRRYLITGKGLWLYYFLTLNYPKQDYVKRLRYFMDKAVEIKTQTI